MIYNVSLSEYCAVKSNKFQNPLKDISMLYAFSLLCENKLIAFSFEIKTFKREALEELSVVLKLRFGRVNRTMMKDL